MNNDLISREALKNEIRAIYHCADTVEELANTMEDVIDNASPIEINKIEYKAYNEGFKDGVEQGIRLSDRPQGKCSRYKRRFRMSNDKLNDAIKTIKELCEVQKACIKCPMNCNCGNCPKDWEEEKNNA